MQSSGKIPRCGDVLRAFSTTQALETLLDTRGNDLGHSKNEKDWIIRRLTSYVRYDRIWKGLTD